jgi:alpha,alpha-trehalose phosphorylase
MDLDDLEHNTRDGVHIASLAGAWSALVNGFGGLRTIDGALAFAPRLPVGLERLAFRLGYRGRRLRVTATPTQASYVLLAGEPLPLTHHGEALMVTAEASVSRPIPPAPQRPRPQQPPGREPLRPYPSR